nr:hypothetical protein [Rhodococcus wratislaviensis]GLK33776.1 hypothetical protein GCM10017611_06190 [Rhodococcus wratislaviensis]
MAVNRVTESGIRIPGTCSYFLDPNGSGDHTEGRLRYGVHSGHEVYSGDPDHEEEKP